MTEPYLLWALLVGLAVGVSVTWFAIGRLPRRSDDVSPEERVVEASWISSEVSARGSQVAQRVVEEILELHEQYLAGPAVSMTPEERAALAAQLARRSEAAKPRRTARGQPFDRPRSGAAARQPSQGQATAPAANEPTEATPGPTRTNQASPPQRRAER